MSGCELEGGREKGQGGLGSINKGREGGVVGSRIRGQGGTWMWIMTKSVR